MSAKETVETLIENSLRELSKIGREGKVRQGAESRLIFPKYSTGEKRISEQELRFLLARELEKQKRVCYSIETPTKDKHSFSGNKDISARIDLCLHDFEGERIHLIELKHNNIGVKNDFLKLLCEPETAQNYFVHIVNNSDNKRTVSSIKGKYQEALDYVLGKGKKIKSPVKIFLFVIRKRDLYQYEITKSGNLQDCEQKHWD